MISLAVLPLGLIAFQQTAQVVRDARELQEKGILFRTAIAAADEQELFREAFGAAHTIAAVALEVGADDPLCDRIMDRLLRKSSSYVFAGFISGDGMLECAADGAVFDFSEEQSWLDFLADPRPQLSVNRQGAVSGQSVVIATVPVFDNEDATFIGAASVSVPHFIADRMLSVPQGDLRVALVSRTGEILSTARGIDAAFEFETFGIVPETLSIPAGGVTRDVQDNSGRDRLLAILPVYGNEVYILGIWDEETAGIDGLPEGWAAALFPLLMWGAALTIAIIALERLVLRHLRRLRQRMTEFSPTDPREAFVDLDFPPAEFNDIAKTYNAMVKRIITDRRDLASALTEKELLLREVHHRVKNNLQLIASILNMQIRATPSGREQSLLRRVQERVMSLSVVHRALYEDTHVGPVRADRLLTTVIEAIFRGALPPNRPIETSIETDEVTLDADQAVPLALLAAEAVANAIKFMGQPKNGSPTIRTKLIQDPQDGRVTLTISNSRGARVIEPADGEASGLGARLIESFASQLGGLAEDIVDEDLFTLRLSFQPLEEDVTATEGDLQFFGARGDASLTGVR